MRAQPDKGPNGCGSERRASRSADRCTVRFRYAIAGVMVVGLLALSPGATAARGGPVAGLSSQQCAQERADIGKRAFRKRYGRKHAMRTCARRNRARVAGAAGTAAQDCQEELADLGETDFIDEYADLAHDSADTAMAECIAEEVDQILNPDDYIDDDGTEDEE